MGLLFPLYKASLISFHIKVGFIPKNQLSCVGSPTIWNICYKNMLIWALKA